MELAVLTLKQVIMLFIMIMAGFFGAKTGAIKTEAKTFFSDLLMKVTVPAMMVHSYMMEFDETVFSNTISVLGWSALTIFLSFVVTFLITGRMQGKDMPIIRCACVFSNSSYMGFPLILALFGSEGMIYASAFVTVLNLYLWSIQYALFTGKVHLKELLRTMLTMPSMVAIIIGLVIYLGRIPVPDIIKTPLNSIGSMTSPLAMIITGMIMAGTSIKKQLCDKRMGLILGLRMFLIPLACIALFHVMNAQGMSAAVIQILMCGPSAAVTTVFAVQFGYDEELTAAAVVVTTFLSIFTLPLWAYLIEYLVM